MEVAVLPIDSHHILKKDIWPTSNVGFVNVPYPWDFANCSADYLTRFWQFARLDINGLPDIVEKAIENGKRAIESVLPPFMWVSKQGHEDIGAGGKRVYRKKYYRFSKFNINNDHNYYCRSSSSRKCCVDD